MKSLAFLVFLYLVMPGSGQLVWDGLPLSTRAEVAGLVVLLLAITSRSMRSEVRSRIAQTNFRGAIKPLIALLCVIKLLTFAWYPFSDGFDACYRSVYLPLENPESCEKSYEGPFLLRSDLGFDNTSRIERTVDFGTHMHDWSLPFMNEYPRLGAQWLLRFPFTASYGAVLRNDSNRGLLLPIYGNGEITGGIGNVQFNTANIPLVDRYEFPRLIVQEIPQGLSEFRLDYRFSDDDAIEPPDSPPPVRGPYATLKVGKPQDRESLLRFVNIRVRGWTADTERGMTPDYVFAADSSQQEIGRAEMQERPDVASYLGNPALSKIGFNFAIPARSVDAGAVSIFAVYGTRISSVAVLNRQRNYLPELPNVTLRPQVGERGDLTSWFDADRNDLEALAPKSRQGVPIGLGAMLALLDAMSGLFIFAALALLLKHLARSIVPAAGIAFGALALLELGSKFAPELLGTRLTLPVLAFSVMVFAIIRFSTIQTTLIFLPAAVILGAHKAFDQLERYHGSEGDRWWGRLLFYWRDSDWYATQGYARTIFLEGSLRGGESLFWFQAGPRYLAFASRILLGENDVLAGIIMTTLGFFAILFLGFRFLSNAANKPSLVVGGFALTSMLYFMSDDLMAGFGFVGSSEYPTWIVLFVAAGFIISTRSESRAWPMVVFALVLGYSIQLRPNQIGGIVMLFVAMLLLVDRTDVARAIGTWGKMLLAFSAVTLFSLWHNLYYGESFVPFTANAGINHKFSWLDVLGLRSGEDSLSTVWDQLRFMMYWNTPGNWAWAFLFWGAQLLWIVTIAYRYRRGLLFGARSLYLLIPFGYALPMLKYLMDSYYPRHLVAINLAFLLTALMAWPHSNQTKADHELPVGETTDSTSKASDVAAVSVPSR
jgi:hypothetical protein